MKIPSIRFGLRTVAVVTVVSAIACAVLAMIARQVERQKKISKTIVSVGGEFFHSHVVERRDSVTPKWLLKKLGIDTFEGLAQIQLERTDIECIEFLSGLTGVKNLYLDRTRIHDLTPIAVYRRRRIADWV